MVRGLLAPGGWRALLALVLLGLTCCVARSLPALVITEIMYHPPEADQRRYEYIEVFNENPDPLDLSGYFICNGVGFTFPRGTFLSGLSYLVVCADESAIQSKYGLASSLTVGNWEGSLDNAGERVEICNPGGRTVVEVRYNDRGKWPSAADGTGHSLALVSEYVDVADADNWRLSTQMGGTPGRINFNTSVSFEDTTLVTDDEVWRYFKGTENPPSSWKTLGFDDSSWLSGPTGIGYGDNDDRTVLDDMQGNYWTVFCRKKFTVDNPEQIDSLVLRVTYDDGFYAYFNNTEVAATNVTGTDFDAPAAGGGEPQTQEITLNRDLLEAGENILAVQVHNTSLGSSDLSFIPELVSRRTIVPEESEIVPVVINEGLFLTAGERWVELYNYSGATIDLSGYFLTDDRQNLTKSELASGTQIPAGGYLSFTETELGLDLSAPGVGDRLFLALVMPSGERVVDAYLFEPRLEGMSEARVPDGDSEFDDAADPTRGATNRLTVNTDVVINEVMYHAIDDDLDREFVELYNRGTQAVDMGGWALTRGLNLVFPSGTAIPAGGYLVVARDPQLIREIYGLAARDVLGPEQTPEALDAFGQLRDRGERLTLQDELGRTVDTLSFRDGGEWPRWADGHGSSMELVDPWQDNRFGQAWDASDDSGKSITEEFSYIGTHGGGESELHVLLLSRGITLVDDVEVIGGGVQVNDTPFIDDGETWRYLKGTEAPPADWNQPGFDDASWLTGATGIGYGDGDDVTVLGDMGGNYLTVFCRKTFNIPNQAVIDDMDEFVLSIIVDDGFVAYLNGVEVASYNVSDRAWDAPATGTVGNGDLIVRDISGSRNLLRVGENLLAVQVHNTSLSSSDLSFIPLLVDRTTTLVEGTNQVVNSTFDSDTSGWMIEGTHWRSGRTIEDAIRGSGSLKIVAAGRGDNKVNRIETTNTGIGILTAGEELQIRLKARWVVGSQTILTHGYEHAMARSHEMAVPEDLGTPGRRNSVAERLISQTGDWNQGPVITDVEQMPPVPGGNEAVLISARVMDADGVSSVNIHYSLNDPSPSPETVAMAHAGGDLYRGTIPGQPLGTKVVFFISAEDDGARQGRYPVDIRNVTHPLVLNPANPGLNEHRYLIYRHDQRDVSTPYHSYRFWMTDADEARLGNRRLLSNDPVPGSFVYEGDRIYHEAHTRFGGSPFARGAWGSFRVTMPRGDELHGRIRKFGMDNHHGNGLSANERISYYLIRNNQGSITVPYSEILTMVRWQVNSRVTSTLEQLWVPDAQFISLWFPGDDDGDFLEMDDRFVISDSGGRIGNTNGRLLYPTPSSRSDGDGTNKENYRWFFGLRSKNGIDDYSNFIELCRLMDPGVTSNTAFDEEIFEQVNVEEFLRMWAVRLNTADWDQWSANRGKNCYFYRPSIDGRWNLLAYDMELTYGDVNSFLIPENPSAAYNPGGFAEVNRMFNRPKIKRMWYAILDEMVNGPNRWFHSDHLSPYMSRLQAHGMAGTDRGQPGGFIDQRADRLQQRIQDAVFPQVRLRITTNGGANFSTDELSVNLAGTAPAQACFLLVVNNGAPGSEFPTTFTSMTDWRLTDIWLIPGPNELTIFGFDLRGDLVDSDSITVTCTAVPLDPPTINALDPAEAMVGEDIVILGENFIPGVRVFFDAVESTAVAFDPGQPGRITARVPPGSGAAQVTARNVDGQSSNAVLFRYHIPGPEFIRGDANDDGDLSVSDGIKILLFLFRGVPLGCVDAADADDNEAVNISDASYVLNFLFLNGPVPLAPFPERGEDPAGVALGCERP